MKEKEIIAIKIHIESRKYVVLKKKKGLDKVKF